MKKQVIIYLLLLHSSFIYGQFTKFSIADTPNRGNRGAALDPIGDVNNDGIKDFVAGAWLEDITSFKNAGKAYVISGSDQSIIRELVSPAPQIEGWFGYSVASGFDLSGDAIQDIVVGAPGENGGAAGSGKVHVFNGANGALLYSLSSPSAVINGNFGNAVLIQMDLDGNGSREIIVGAYQEHGLGLTASGKVHVFNGNLFRNSIISGNSEEYGGFGWRIATANNFLGTTSLIVSAIFENPGASPINSGVLYAFNMANPNSPLLKMMQEQSPTIFGCFGWSLSFYNDVSNGGGKLVVMDELGKITTINNDGTQGLVNTQYGYGANSIVTGKFNNNLIPDFAIATNVIYDILDSRTLTNIASGSRLFIYQSGFGDAIMNLGDNNNDTKDEIVAYSATSIGETFIYQINSAPVIPPTITSFTPSSGGAYTSITITGTNFGLNGNTVKFNGKETYSYAINATSLQTSVPVGSTTGPISVTFGGEKATSTLDFIVPTFISSFSPVRSSIGSSIVITGANFNSTPANNVVRFGAARAIVTAVSATSLTVTVPFGATCSPISILNNGLMAYSSERFVPTFAGSSTIDATSLATKFDFPTGANPNTVVTGDLDDDGKIDIVTANQSANSISIFRNTSSSGVFTAGTFAAKVDLSTGTGSAPIGITLKDFDGDGKLDIAVANSGASSVSVFRNISTSGSLTVSSFAASVQFVTGTNPYWCDGADVDGDGRTDLITANSGSNSISVLRNLSTPGSITAGSFAVKSDWTTGTQPYHLSIGDLDGDGRPEVATANFTGQSLSLLKNNSSTGNISFYPKVDFSASYPVRVAMGDVDNDGLTDLVLTNYGATGNGTQISVYKNQTPQQNSQLGTQIGSLFSGSLAVPNTYTTPIGPYGVGLSDLNGDGYIDIAISSYQINKLSIFKNQGDGSFASKVDFNTGTQSYDVTIGDFDGDTRVDIAVPNYSSASMSLFRNTITFLSPTITNFTPQNAAAGTSVDITGTNFTSTSVVNFGGTAATSFVINSATSITAVVGIGTSGNVSVTTPGGSASLPGFTFLPAPTISSFNPTTAGVGAIVTIGGNNFTGTTAVSFGGTPASSFNVVSATSITAVLAAGASGAVSVTTPGGNATLAGFTFIPIPTITSFNPTSAASGATVTITGTNFTGATAVSFGGTAATSFSVVSSTSITAVVASGTSGSVSVTTPGGTATLAGFTIVPAPTITSFNPTSGAVGTAVTITGTNFSPTAASNIVYFGAIKATVTAATATQLIVTVPVGSIYSPISITLAGLTGYSSKPFKVTFSGGGTILLSSIASKVDFVLDNGTKPWDVVLGDVDGDGKLDMVVTYSLSNTVSVLRNTSTSGSVTSSSFATKVDFATGIGPYSVTLGDIDGDGKLDIIVANLLENTISIFRNTSTSGSITSGSFAAKVDVATGLQPFGVAIGDLDSDGKPDIVVANRNWPGLAGDNIVSVLRNTSTIGSISASSFATRVDFPSGASAWAVDLGDIDGDGKLDIAATNSLGNSISILHNTSVMGSIALNSFATKVDFVTGNAPWDIELDDVDGDGKLDMVVANNGSSSLSLFRNTSSAGIITSASFAAKVDYPTGLGGPTKIALDDFNGDSKADLAVVTYDNSKVAMFQNTSITGSASFAVNVGFATGAGPWGVAAGDVDGDGKPDFVVANQNDFSVSVLRNAFIVAPTPTIANFNPANGAIGTSVTITGTNFSTTPANNIVKFSGTLATITGTPTATSIVTTVPAGATTGKITVEVGGQIATSSADFTVSASAALTITTESFLTSFDKGSTLTVSVTVNDASLVSAVNLKTRGITEASTAVKTVAVTAVGNKFEKVIAASDLTDPIGLVYSFEVLNKATPAVAVNSTTGKAYVKFPTASTDQVLPGLSFGDQVGNYQIIAVPLDLTDKSVSKVFASLMPYNKAKWRLFDYSSNDNREYSAFSTIDAGKGYWLIVKTNTTINPGEGKAVQADDTSPFTINLTTGWNLIGNPYNFRISWPDVLAANSNPAGVGTSLKIFSAGALTDGTVLEKYRGAFVFSANAVALKIPVLKTLTGRTNEMKPIENGLDQNQWEVKLNLQQGILRNELGGIGMNPKATLLGKDTFDEVSVPLPDGLGLFELAYPHPEVFADFNKEIVPTQENFTWEFDVNRDDQNVSLDLNWSNHYFGENDKQLVLFDPATSQVVDMRLVNHYVLTEQVKKLKILFGGKDYVERALDKELPWLGNAYPNPAREELTIPFRVPESHDQMMVQIKVYNSQGLEVATPINRILAKGSYNVKWLPQGESGLYIIRMKIGQQETTAMKVIIN